MKFKAWTCVLPVKPQDAVGRNDRRFPRTCGEVHLSREDAGECSHFQNVDDPAPDKVYWVPTEIVVPALTNFAGDTPLIPDGAATVA